MAESSLPLACRCLWRAFFRGSQQLFGCTMFGADLPANPMPRWVPMANVDSAAMLVAFLGWYRDQVARRERLFYSMGMDNVMTLVMHGAVGEPTVSEWVDDHYIPLRRVLCDGVLCGRCLALGGDSDEPNGYVFRWYSPLWESLYMDYRNPLKQSWVPADGFLLNDPAEDAVYRGGVARDENGRCLVPLDRWAPTAYVMGVLPPHVQPSDSSTESSDAGDSQV